MNHPHRIDTAALKRLHPIAAVVTRYGIRLHPSGRALVGRCPFHNDRGRPNLHLYPDTDRWWCYRCNIGGDVIDFVACRENLGFREACARLGEHPSPEPAAPLNFAPGTAAQAEWGEAERGALHVAVERYHERLLREPVALGYCATRGLDRESIVRFRIGYATGGDLRAALGRAELSRQIASRMGLLGRDGTERFVGRIVVPELRAGEPLWLIGRTLPDRSPGQPKYLGLPGRKPLLGRAEIAPDRAVFVTEGVFDRLTLARWGYPTVALAGTHARRDVLTLLARFPRVYLVLDNDQAGREATARIGAALGLPAVPVELHGVKDVADLGRAPDGAALFRRAVARAESASARTRRLAA